MRICENILEAENMEDRSSVLGLSSDKPQNVITALGCPGR